MGRSRSVVQPLPCTSLCLLWASPGLSAAVTRSSLPQRDVPASGEAQTAPVTEHMHDPPCSAHLSPSIARHLSHHRARNQQRLECEPRSLWCLQHKPLPSLPRWGTAGVCQNHALGPACSGPVLPGHRSNPGFWEKEPSDNPLAFLVAGCVQELIRGPPLGPGPV